MARDEAADAGKDDNTTPVKRAPENMIVGRAGEALAADYLQAQGYEITGRNIRCELGEIDLIATRNEYLVFVEVKTRSKASGYHPTLAITAAKKKKLRELGAWYLAQHPPRQPMQPRFDVVTVVLAPKGGKKNRPDKDVGTNEAEVIHYPNAF